MSWCTTCLRVCSGLDERGICLGGIPRSSIEPPLGVPAQLPPSLAVRSSPAAAPAEFFHWLRHGRDGLLVRLDGEPVADVWFASVGQAGKPGLVQIGPWPDRGIPQQVRRGRVEITLLAGDAATAPGRVEMPTESARHRDLPAKAPPERHVPDPATPHPAFVGERCQDCGGVEAVQPEPGWTHRGGLTCSRCSSRDRRLNLPVAGGPASARPAAQLALF